MTSDVHLRDRAWLHLWCAVGYAGFYCAVVIGRSMPDGGQAASMVLAMLGVWMTALRLMKSYRDDFNTSVEKYVTAVFADRRGLSSMVCTAMVTLLCLGGAGAMAGVGDPVRVAAVEGARNGAFLCCMLYIWRLKPEFRAICLICWAGADIWVLWRLGSSVGAQSGSITLLTTVLCGWACLMVQDLTESAVRSGSA